MTFADLRDNDSVTIMSEGVKPEMLTTSHFPQTYTYTSLLTCLLRMLGVVRGYKYIDPPLSLAKNRDTANRTFLKQHYPDILICFDMFLVSLIIPLETAMRQTNRHTHTHTHPHPQRIIKS